ncbi:right-handed parallel beta-helix repeat-containing protein [Aquimarina sp. MMG016]|uniref:right-handed parallel beta-helix repeat-containing protein n=1 Tax=Aquimarina sp. MMG016 TaxID=2822690 RepID=UPI001B3A08A9|nr:right-handed parallel beta-helix repeat-containing protein [Aquimarina sp. MMG016]MBQ4819282.1 right-handed parallel beta-helix repeat-containing protein [Aquimarina sp. MMG016]
MKSLFPYLLIVFTIVIVSCSNESLDTDLPSLIIADPELPENTSTTPCDFDLSDVTVNQTLVIDCVLDLRGETVTLPENVIFEFDKGDIINGTLNFTGGGRIDGRLLNSKLTLEGDVQLIDPTFKFYALRWDLVEGSTISDIALQNTEILERVMFLTKYLGATTFLINKLNAFFEVTKVTSTTSDQNFYPSLEAVNIPSNFTLEMTDKTHLRIFPGEAGTRGGTILAVRDVENVTIKGGTLYGDRDQRIYSPNDDGQEGSHLFHIHSGRNITVDGIRFEEGSVGSIAIYSFGFSFNPNYNPTNGVVIRNCVFKDSRRMSIALTDGRDILIEGNTFINNGMPSTNSDGGEVGYAINIEPDRFRDDNGVLMERQKVFDVQIRGNTETGSRGGFVTLTIGQDLTVEDNDIGTRVVYSLVSGSKVSNNRFTASGSAADSWAIFAAGSGETVFDNEIAGNIITGYSLGIAAGSIDAYIHDNTITDCGGGIQINRGARQARIINNTISVTGNGVQATNTEANDVLVLQNTITSEGFHVYFVNLNNTEEHKDQKVVLEDNTFINSRAVTFSNSRGITFIGNEIDGGMEVGNVFNTRIVSNIIRPNESDGIRLFGTHQNVEVMNNTVYEPTGAARYICINNNSDTPEGIVENGNTCN